MVEYIEKKKALGIYVLKAFVVDDQRHAVRRVSLVSSVTLSVTKVQSLICRIYRCSRSVSGHVG